MNPIRHIAGPYEDGVQQCTRCLKIIIDQRKDLWPSDYPFGGFRKGKPVCNRGAAWFLDDYLAIDCLPMEAGL